MTTKTGTMRATLERQGATILHLESEVSNIRQEREVVRQALRAAELLLKEQRDQIHDACERAEQAERQVSDLRLTLDLLARAIAVQAGARFAAVGAPRAVGS